MGCWVEKVGGWGVGLVQWRRWEDGVLGWCSGGGGRMGCWVEKVGGWGVGLV